LNGLPVAPAPRKQEFQREGSPNMELSARNQLKGKVRSVKLGAVMAEVVLDVAGQEMVSEISKGSAERLALKAGDAVTVIIKSTEVLIGK
jgi:molybdopterin-binding protein